MATATVKSDHIGTHSRSHPENRFTQKWDLEELVCFEQASVNDR